MSTDLLVVALVVGLGTWLFRFLPTRMGSLWSEGSSRLTAAMQGIGPAAIVTLFIASVLPRLVSGPDERSLVLIGAAATLLGFMIRRNIVLATLTGAAAYGVAFAVLAG